MEMVDMTKCVRCARLMSASSAFLIAGERRCFRCAIRYPRLLYRSLKTALVVGTVLVTINYGPTLVYGGLPSSAWWRIPLNYVVPFCVATWGALGNARANNR
jgi:hypothetical protein